MAVSKFMTVCTGWFDPKDGARIHIDTRIISSKDDDSLADDVVSHGICADCYKITTVNSLRREELPEVGEGDSMSHRPDVEHLPVEMAHTQQMIQTQKAIEANMIIEKNRS